MRIISGFAGGRRLKTLPGLNTRPTSDKVKGAIFSVLGDRVLAAKVLDVFAGSGALALEALSRGAEYAVMVEKNPRGCEVIRENIIATGLGAGAKVINRDGITSLKEMTGEKFNLVFIDPPYRCGLAVASLELLAQGNNLAPDAVIIVETSREEKIPVELGKISLRKSSKYGDTNVLYYQLTETEGREN